MLLSHTAEYALRAVLFLAEHGRERAVRVDEMARALRLPRNYLSKTLHQLARSGVLASTRGKAGGFRLAVPAERLTLHRVVAPFGDVNDRRRCLLGRPACSDRTACAAHDQWRDVAEHVSTFFRETTVADLQGATLPA
jgi:Rrf2 family protein